MCLGDVEYRLRALVDVTYAALNGSSELHEPPHMVSFLRELVQTQLTVLADAIEKLKQLQRENHHAEQSDASIH